MDIVELLTITRDRTLPYFKSSEEELLKSYGPGKWNVKQLLHHIADAETVLYDRIRRTISNPNQVVWGFDQDKWAEELNYNQLNLELSKNIYMSVRAAIIELAKLHYISKGQFQAVHSGTGVRTLKQFFDKVAWHNSQHLDQIESALENKPAFT